MPDHPRAPRRPQRPGSCPAFRGPAAAFAYDLFRFVSRPHIWRGLRTLALEFARLIHERDGAALEPWLVAAETSELAALRGFATGLRRDQAAVAAALAYAWSSGQVEGHVNKLKLVKRGMFGRAGFACLRRRFLLAG